MPLQRILNPHGGVLGAKLVDLQCVFTLGAGGAVSAVKGKGFATSDWTDNGTGDFTIQLPGTGTLSIYEVTATLSDDATQAMVCRTVVVSESARTVNVETWELSATPAVADPTSGAKLRLKVTVKESSEA